MSKSALVYVDMDMVRNVYPCLREAGYKITCVDDEEEGEHILRKRRYDLIVVECAPTDEMENCLSKLRCLTNGAILILVKSGNFAETEPYLHYADDVLLIDFNPVELTIRAKALMKYPRAPWNNREKDGLPLVFGDLCIFNIGKRVTYRRAIIHFTRTEFNILYYLACNAGAVISRYEIYAAVWHETDVYDIDVDKNINNHISNIRKKLKNHTKHDYIRAESGEGYVFIPIIEE